VRSHQEEREQFGVPCSRAKIARAGRSLRTPLILQSLAAALAYELSSDLLTSRGPQLHRL
jgi:hypothetical protein